MDHMDGIKDVKIKMFDNMDNVAYDEDTEKGTEMDLVQSTKKGHPRENEPSTSYPSTSCRPEVCQAARARYPGPDLRGSPWSRNKSIILVIIIALLVIWIIIYATLSKYDLL